MLNYTRHIKIFFFLSVTLLIGYTAKGQAVKSIPDAEPKMLFLVLKLHKDSVSGINSIELLSQQIAPGKIKKRKQKTAPKSYIAVSLWQQDNLIATEIVDHPLFKQLEYTDEKGLLKSKFVELNAAEFFTRLQLSGNADMLSISEVINNSPQEQLMKIQIKK